MGPYNTAGQGKNHGDKNAYTTDSDHLSKQKNSDIFIK